MAETTLPAASYISNAARTEGEAKTFFEDHLQVAREMPGSVASTELTIATGSVTPTTGSHSVDTESDASTDDLDNVLTTNMADGRVLLLRAEDNARVVTVKHESGGAGQIHTANAADVLLDDTGFYLLVARRGADWYEVARGLRVGTDDVQIPSNTDLPLRGYGDGLVVSDGPVDPLQDVSISAGVIRDSTDTTFLRRDALIIKQIDATWAAGSNGGGLFSGSAAADTWYYIFVIKKDSDGTVDAGFDTSPVAANIPAGYTAFQMIGARLTHPTAGPVEILLGYNAGGWFYYDTPQNVNVTSHPASAVSRTIDVPPLTVPTLLRVNVADTTPDGTTRMLVSSLLGAAITPTDFFNTVSISAQSGLNTDANTIIIVADSSAQVRTEHVGVVAADIRYDLSVIGYQVPRGQDA